MEVRRGNHAIVARVMWREGGKAGLRADERIPIEDIVTLGQAPAYSVPAATGERRKNPRTEDRSRLHARAIQFAGIALIGACLASAGLLMFEQAFARPLAVVAASLAS